MFERHFSALLSSTVVCLTHGRFPH